MNLDFIVKETIRLGADAASKKFGLSPATSAMISTGILMAVEEIKKKRQEENEAQSG